MFCKGERAVSFRCSLMKKIGINKTKIYTGIFIIIHVTILLVLYLCGILRYEVKDDFLIAAIAGGTFGFCTPYVVYPNIIVGQALSCLFMYFPWINWATCMYLFLSIVAFTLFFYIMLQKYGFRAGQMFAYAILFLMIPILYQSMNYTKFAGVFSIIGFMIIQHALEREKCCKWMILCGEILVVLGGLLRFKAFLLMLPFVLLLVIKKSCNYKVLGKNIKKKYIVVVTITVLLVLSMQLVNNVVYRLDDEWVQYAAFNNARTELFDYATPSYEEYSEEYQKLGISENDVKMIRRGMLSDSKIFDTKNLEAIISFRNDNDDEFRSINKTFWGNLFQKIFTEYLKYSYLIIALVISASAFEKKKEQVLLLISAWGLSIAEIAYLEYMGRPIERVVVLPMLALVFVLVYSMPSIATRDIQTGIVRIVVLILAIGFFMQTAIAQESIARDDHAAEFVESIKDKEGLYVCNASDIYRGYSIFDLPLKDGLENMIFETGWLVQLPYTNHVLKEHLGTDNLYGSVVHNPELFFVQYADQTRLTFLREHYDSNIGCSLVGNECGYNIYTYAAPLENVRITDLQWRIDFSNNKCIYNEEFYELEIVTEQEIKTKDVYLEICDAEHTDVKYVYKVCTDQKKLMCYFEAADWLGVAQAECNLYFVDEDSMKCRESYRIRF